MSSMPYGSSTDDPSAGAIIPHPYLTSNTYPTAATLAAAAAAASPSTLGPYQHYYGHALPPPQPQQFLPQSSTFYSPTTMTSHQQQQQQQQQQGDFSNSSSSIASSSSSMESARKNTTRKRSTDKATKSGLKRKAPANDDDDDELDDDDDDEENKCYLRSAPVPNPNPSNAIPGDEDKEKQARENHCEIERRRRIKMATYFAELCDMVPACSNLARKPDKLTILRMAAHFMKTLRTNNHSLALNSPSISPQQDLYKPSFLNDQELKYLMVESCDAFLFALNCDTLRVIYVSDAIQQVLSYTCQDWYSRFIYDFIHPDDVEKVREQLNLQSQDGSPNGNVNGRILDLKTGTVKKDGHNSGTRLISSKRSFICRLRVGSTNLLDPSHSNSYGNPAILRRRHRISLGPSIDGQLYEVVHINGYIRNLNTHPSHHENAIHHPSSSNTNSQMAFIAIARLQTSSIPNVNDLTNGSISTLNSSTTEFTCRCHWETGEILFIDQRCTPIIGYKSQELVHKILAEQIHPDDRLTFEDLYKRTVTQKNLLNTASTIHVRFRTNIDSEYVSLKTSTYAFCNPCTDDIEFIIVTFLSNQTNNKTAVITNSNDYNRPTYPSYSRSAYENPNERDYSNGNTTNDARTYASNNGGSTWAPANENWTAATAAAAVPVSASNPDYTETQANLGMYHQYH